MTLSDVDFDYPDFEPMLGEVDCAPTNRKTARLGYCSITHSVQSNVISKKEAHFAKLEMRSIAEEKQRRDQQQILKDAKKVEVEYPNLPTLIKKSRELHKGDVRAQKIDADICKFSDWATVAENYRVKVRKYNARARCIKGKSWGFYEGYARACNRFSQERRELKLKLIYKIFEFEQAKGTTEFTLLTLTVRHENTWEDTMIKLKRNSKLLLNHIRLLCPGTRYISIVEPHPSPEGNAGFPHIHMVLAGRFDNTLKTKAGRGFEDHLRDKWSHSWNAGDHEFGLDFTVVSDQKKALNYILKYVGKSFFSEKGWSLDELIFNTQLNACSQREVDPKIYRTLSLSKDYSRLIKKYEPDADEIVLKTELEPQETSINGVDMPPHILNERLYIPAFIGSPRYEGIIQENVRERDRKQNIWWNCREMGRDIGDTWGRPHVGHLYVGDGKSELVFTEAETPYDNYDGRCVRAYLKYTRLSSAEKASLGSACALCPFKDGCNNAEI